MIRGLYAAAAGMAAELRRSEVLANNLANVNTPGFRKERLAVASFPLLLVHRLRDGRAEAAMPGGALAGSGQPVPLGTVALGPVGETLSSYHAPAERKYTGQAWDLALAGNGFFVLDTPAGLRYTRQGNFHVAEGYLVSSHGYRVQGELGPIRMSEDGQDLRVDERGQLWDGDRPAGRLLVVDFDGPEALGRDGHSLFRPTPGSGDPVPVANPRVQQGYLEVSNVNPLEEMVDLIAVLRSYEAGQKAVQAQDESLQKAVNVVGRI